MKTRQKKVRRAFCTGATGADHSCGCPRCERVVAELSNATVACRICDEPTRSTGTRLCDRCWEMERRIHYDPEIARRILDALPGEIGVAPTARDCDCPADADCQARRCDECGTHRGSDEAACHECGSEKFTEYCIHE